MIYRFLIKPLLFRVPPEMAHSITFRLIRWLFPVPGIRALILAKEPTEQNEAVHLWGLRFPNRVGLAAGFDKDAKLVQHWEDMGFGFIEIGTVTPKPQSGNERPRLFRLPLDEALINRMGFNNLGVDHAAVQLQKRKGPLIVGGNIGKNKSTPNEQAVEDYATCMRKLHPFVDFFTVNISSPNTPGLRALQEKEPLRDLLTSLTTENNSFDKKRPILLKIAPDMSIPQVNDLLEVVLEVGLEGMIVSNTTLDRSGLRTDKRILDNIGAGGLSGKPLKEKSNQLIAYIYKKTQGNVPIIAVGGIMTAEDALEKLELGASLVQLYTGLVYKGPQLITEIRRAIKHKKK